jgi:hypothetical protein
VSAFQFSAWGIADYIYSTLRNIILGNIIILFLLNLKKISSVYNRISLLKTHINVLIITSIILLTISAFITGGVFSPVRDLAIALIILIIGINLDLNEKRYKNIVKTFIVTYTLAAISIVFTYSTGLVIQELYMPIPKNQLAPAYGVAFILSLYFIFSKENNNKLFYIIFSGLLFASLLVIRGRAVIVSVIFTVILLIFYYIKSKKYKIVTILGIIILIPFVGQFLYDALFLNYDISDIDSVSTGRMTRNIDGLEFLFANPLGGQLENSGFTGGTIHNYILYNLVNYGIIVGGILLIVYFKYIFKIVASIRQNKFQYYESGPLVMVILFLISLFEYTYPFSPGSAIFFPFFLMGQYLRKSNS